MSPRSTGEAVGQQIKDARFRRRRERSHFRTDHGEQIELPAHEAPLQVERPSQAGPGGGHLGPARLRTLAAEAYVIVQLVDRQGVDCYVRGPGEDPGGLLARPGGRYNQVGELSR